ncbi:MAG: hypothetical protein QNK04_21525 [Myxococcota bacterium]|nr:hypothetical protein [Myxococcota bacterium]
MSRPRASLGLALLMAALLGSDCGGGSGSGGGDSVRRVQPVDPRCATLSSFFPSGFDFVPGRPELGWVVDQNPPTLIPLDTTGVPPQPADGFEEGGFLIPDDSDGDGQDDPVSPVVDDFDAVREDLALVTASEYEVVLFFDPVAGRLREFDVRLPRALDPRDYPFYPPGGATEKRTGVSNFFCLRPAPGALDSQGNPLVVNECGGAAPSYFGIFTSGAALAGGRMFVSMSNLQQGGIEPVYRPGAVLVFQLDADRDPPIARPNGAVPYVFTTGYNPTHVTPVSVGGRDFVLVTVSGAVGLREDDPATDEIEAGGVPLTPAAIDVIDAQSLELVATIPLGLAGLSFDRLAVDPTGRVAAVGSAAGRLVFVVDLAPLASLPSSVTRPVVLDGSEGPSAVVFDAASPLEIPAADFGAPEASCAGFSVGLAFNDAGDRIYVTEFCDGTLATVGVDLSGSPPVPVPQDRFAVVDLDDLFAPLRAETDGLPRAPGTLEVRPGVPGVDYDGPDLTVLVGQPGLACGIRVESP